MKKLILLALFASLLLLVLELPWATGSAAGPKKERVAGHGVGQSSVELASESPSYLVLPPGAFSSDGQSPGSFYIDPDYGYLHGTGAPTNMWAPLYLPPGTSIASLEVFLEDWDSEPGKDVCVYLDRMDLATGTYECCLAEVCSTGAGSEYVLVFAVKSANLVVGKPKHPRSFPLIVFRFLQGLFHQPDFEVAHSLFERSVEMFVGGIRIGISRSLWRRVKWIAGAASAIRVKASLMWPSSVCTERRNLRRTGVL